MGLAPRHAHAHAHELDFIFMQIISHLPYGNFKAKASRISVLTHVGIHHGFGANHTPKSSDSIAINSAIPCIISNEISVSYFLMRRNCQ